jgi:pilus assembly protein CpaE
MANGDDISMLAFVKDEADAAALRAFASSQQLGEESVLIGDIHTAVEYLAAHTPPTLLMVEVIGKNQTEVAPQLEKLADVCAPDTKVVIVGSVNEYSFFCWLQEIGIFHYMLKPLVPEALDAMYAKALAKGSAGVAEKKLGKVVGIIGTRGGSGSSTLSTLLAGLMAERTKKPVGLVELDPQDGTIALLLDIEPSRGFRDAIEKPDRIDSLFLERVMVKASDHLSILSAEDGLHESIHFSEDAADKLFPILKEKFAFSFVDVSHHFNPFSLKSLRMCDQIFVVSPMNLQGLRDAMRINEWLKDRCKITHHMFIGNKVGASNKHEVMQSDFEKSLGTKLTETLPYSPELFSEITNDLAVLKKPSLNGFSALENIGKLVNPSLKTGADSAAKGKKASKGFLKKK